MIKRILHHKLLLNSNPSRSVASAAFVVSVAALASRLMGLVRDRLLASTFGAGDTLDVYYAAFRIPDLVYNLLIMGALSAAFIPVFTSLISKDQEKEAWKLANGILNLGALFTLIISAVFFLKASFIMNLITPGFSPPKMDQAVLFTRIMFLSPLFLGVSGVFGGVLTSFKKFLIYSLAPVMYNVGIILGVLVFVKFLGPAGLAWGVVAGAFLHMIIQYPAAKSSGFRHQWISVASLWKDAYVRRIFFLMVPRILGIAVNQLNLFIITIFASTLAAGSIAVLSFAQNMQSVPLGLFGISFSIAAFPVLSAFSAREEREDFIKTFSQTFRQILFFVLPTSVALLVLRAQFVRVILGAGEFNWEDTILTYQCLGIFALSLFAQSVIPLLARSFYALHNTRTPFYIALVSELVNIVSVVLLIEKFKVMGLAIAFSLASAVQMLLLLFVLRTKFEHLDDRRILRSVGRIGAASFMAGLSIQLSKYVVASYANLDTFLGVFTQLTASLILGGCVFFLACYLFKVEEFVVVKQSLTKRLFRPRQPIGEDIKDASGM